jgi:phosphate transport system substrate-binding protein
MKRSIIEMKKAMSKILGVTLVMAALASCSTSAGTASSSPTAAPAPSATTGAITVTSREEGSGTRGAFIELFGVEQKDSSGTKVDYTIDSADITNSTQVMMTSVSQDPLAIGYISLGALNDTVKALEIDGAAATVENIKDGSYKISRPFNIATLGDVSEVAQDFIDFILSSDGQTVVEANGYIASSENGAYSGSKPSGKVVVAGSSSVTPVMEKLKEAYLKVNPNATVEVQQSDSTTGMTSTIDGICDIGMASRELKDSELSAGLNATVIATDGIAVIVNLENTVSGLTAEQVKDIYTGAITDWSEVQ